MLPYLPYYIVSDEFPAAVVQGKTDVAMLTILRVIDQHREKTSSGMPLAATILRGEFKIIYVYVL